MAQVDPTVRHSREAPPWSWCGDRRSPDFGRVFAWPAARGAVALTFDRQGRHHALTIFGPSRPDAEIAIFGRRFDVVRGAETETPA
jgi:hypothetical protein